MQTAEGQPVYAETTAEPFPELYFESEGTLNRFILLDDRGVPATIGETIVFAGQTFAFDRDATGEADPNALCASRMRRAVFGADRTGRHRESAADLRRPQRRYTAVFWLFTRGGIQPSKRATVPTESRHSRLWRPLRTPTETPIPADGDSCPANREHQFPRPKHRFRRRRRPFLRPRRRFLRLRLRSRQRRPRFRRRRLRYPRRRRRTANRDACATGRDRGCRDTGADRARRVPQRNRGSAGEPRRAVIRRRADATRLGDGRAAGRHRSRRFRSMRRRRSRPSCRGRSRSRGSATRFDLEVDIDPSRSSRSTSFRRQGRRSISLRRLTIRRATAAYMLVRRSFTPLCGLRWHRGRSPAISRKRRSPAPERSRSPPPVRPKPARRRFRPRLTTSVTPTPSPVSKRNISVEELRTTTSGRAGEHSPDRGWPGDSASVLEDIRGCAEVFLAGGDQLERYVALNAVGVPVTFNDLIFAETRFRYEAQVSVTINETAFRRIGCSGRFPLLCAGRPGGGGRPADDHLHRDRHPGLSVHRHRDRDRANRSGAAATGRHPAAARFRPDHPPDHGRSSGRRRLRSRMCGSSPLEPVADASPDTAERAGGGVARACAPLPG